MIMTIMMMIIYYYYDNNRSKRPCDDEFTLQMDDLCSGHGFLPQYNGPEVEHIVR